MGFADEDEIESEKTDGVEETPEENSEVEEEEAQDNTRTSNDALDTIAANAMSVDEAAEADNVWKIMLWSDPGQGKTHFSYTMPEPVCFLDTENKADDIAHKFQDKDVYIWQPNDFDEAVDYREEALNFLSEYESEYSQTGTLVVDSMADMWEWSQYKYIEEWYPNTPPDKVNLDLQDWPKIKDYHNKVFRRQIEECKFNVVFTSTRKDDVGAAIDDDLDYTPDKPGGETNNAYKVNSIIRLYLNDKGVPAGDLQKSGFVRFKYNNLLRPTYQKHREIVDHLSDLESDGADSVAEIEEEFNLDYDVRITEANTMHYYQEDSE